MTKTTANLNWIKLRSGEPEFLEFMQASTPAQAIEAATNRCTDAYGTFEESSLTTLKSEYLKFAQQSMGLPDNAGAF